MPEVQRQALVRVVTARLAIASLDEVRVIDRLLTRLELGRDRYGALDLTVPRDWARERGEELLDAVLYDVMGDLAAEDRDRAQLREAARRELVDEWAGDGTVISGESLAIARTVTAEPSEPYTVVVDAEGEHR